MKQFVFPAIFYKKEDKYVALFPDLNMATEGETMEDAYMFAKESLRVYCSYIEKYEIEIEEASKYEDVCKDNPKDIVMLIDCSIKPKE